MDRKRFFSERMKQYTEQLKRLQKQSNRMSTLRLFVFLAGAGSAAWGFYQGFSPVLYLMVVILIILFLYLIFYHEDIENQIKREKCKVEINQTYIDRLEDTWVSFKQKGSELENPEHPYANDLDIFGDQSLFQWITAARSYLGIKALQQLLQNPDKDVKQIQKRQQAVKELAHKIHVCEQIQTEAMLASTIQKDPSRLFQYAENPSALFKQNWLPRLFVLMPIATLASILMMILHFSKNAAIVTTVLFILQICIVLIWYPKLISILQDVYDLKESLNAYRNILQSIEKESFQSDYLKELKARLQSSGNVSKQLNALENIVDAIYIRYSPVVYFILNFLVLWDFHCVFALEKWKKTNGKSLRSWIETVGEFEAICSLAAIPQMYPEWCYPEFTNNNVSFSAKNMGHPLLPQSKRVNNSIEFQNAMLVITGSNMSGKTTLLRTIGINLVLAYAGAPVCAESMKCSVMDIFTSMRIRDNVTEGISTFYAELLRIKKIVEYARKKQPMIFLIDEIFRGTNSKDRIIGAKNVLKQLNKPWITGLISTHDFELCELENMDAKSNYINYHFTEKYVDGKIVFDYKLRTGRCLTSNAQYLMKMVGIEL